MCQLVILSRLTALYSGVYARLWGAAVVEIGRNSEGTKWEKIAPNGKVCFPLAVSYASPQSTTAHAVEARSLWGVWARRIHQIAVVDSQQRHTICFRELEVASQLYRTIEKSLNISITRRQLVPWLHHRWKHAFWPNVFLFFSCNV